MSSVARIHATALSTWAALFVNTAAAFAGTFGFAPGDQLPAYTYRSEDGANRSTADFRGKWWLLKRGAEWCMPCIGERPSVEDFIKAHPEVPVVMLVSPRPNDSDPAGVFKRDLDFQRRKGLRTDYLAEFVSREPSARNLSTPKAVTDLPLTILVNPQGTISALWASTYQYQRHYERLGVAGKAEPRFRDYVEALLSCNGAKIVTTSAAKEIATSFDTSCN